LSISGLFQGLFEHHRHCKPSLNYTQGKAKEGKAITTAGHPKLYRKQRKKKDNRNMLVEILTPAVQSQNRNTHTHKFSMAVNHC